MVNRPAGNDITDTFFPVHVSCSFRSSLFSVLQRARDPRQGTAECFVRIHWKIQ